MVFLIASRMIARRSNQSNIGRPSVVIIGGAPNIDIQDSTCALATDSDEISRSGTAIGQPVKRSVQVRMWVKELDGERTPIYQHGYAENDHQVEEMKRVCLQTLLA